MQQLQHSIDIVPSGKSTCIRRLNTLVPYSSYSIPTRLTDTLIHISTRLRIRQYTHTLGLDIQVSLNNMNDG